MESIYLRKAELNDSEFIYELRNEYSARMNSKNKEIISFETHLLWYRDKLGQGNTDIYILMDGADRVGQIRIDYLNNEDAEISYCIAKEYRRQGYGHKMIALIERAIIDMKRAVVLVAVVSKTNVYSRKIFEKLQYRLEEKKGEFVVYKKQLKRLVAEVGCESTVSGNERKEDIKHANKGTQKNN